MVKVAVAGVAGRMGTRIAQLVRETEGIELAAGFEHPDHPMVSREVSGVVGSVPINLIVRGDIAQVLDDVDAVIDFTNAAVSLRHLGLAASSRKAMVIGSTGSAQDQLAPNRRGLRAGGADAQCAA